MRARPCACVCVCVGAPFKQVVSEAVSKLHAELCSFMNPFLKVVGGEGSSSWVGQSLNVTEKKKKKKSNKSYMLDSKIYPYNKD